MIRFQSSIVPNTTHLQLMFSSPVPFARWQLWATVDRPCRAWFAINGAPRNAKYVCDHDLDYCCRLVVWLLSSRKLHSVWSIRAGHERSLRSPFIIIGKVKQKWYPGTGSFKCKRRRITGRKRAGQRERERETSSEHKKNQQRIRSLNDSCDSNLWEHRSWAHLICREDLLRAPNWFLFVLYSNFNHIY